jgi:hypothetical protein
MDQTVVSRLKGDDVQLALIATFPFLGAFLGGRRRPSSVRHLRQRAAYRRPSDAPNSRHVRLAGVRTSRQVRGGASGTHVISLNMSSGSDELDGEVATCQGGTMAISWCRLWFRWTHLTGDSKRRL